MDATPADDAQLASLLAAESVALLERLRADFAEADIDELRKAGDRRSHEHLMSRLADERPGDEVLSEEGADRPERLQADRVWIVDPLDGTREFGERRSDWAVHVALWRRSDGRATNGGGELVAGAVGLPDGGMLVTGMPPGSVPAETPNRRLRVVASRTRAPALVDDVTAALDAEKVPMGSAGAKIAAVIQGDADVYVHAGGQYEWDSAAPVAVALSLGFHASRLDGSPLLYNQPKPYLPDLVVCRADLAPRVLDIVAPAA